MERLILTAVLILYSVISVAQEELHEPEGKSKKELREEKRAAKKVKKATAMQNSNALLAGRQWILEANRVQDRRGEIFELDPNVNFVSIEEDGGIVQISFLGLPGWNGLGGITLEGNVTKYELLAPQKPGTGGGVRARLQSAARSMDLQIRVTSAGYAEAIIRPTTSSGSITFTGQLVHSDESGVYKGQRRF